MHASPVARVAIALLMASTLPALAARPVIFVRTGAPNGGDGLSWNTAYNKLQDALAAAVPGDDVWVAGGTYRPDEGSSVINNDRSATFNLKNDVAIYGGFSGQDVLFSSRNPAVNVTILSGDLTNTPASNTDNSYHIVTATGVNNTAILDGFTITGGNADQITDPDCTGSALYSINSSQKLVNCIISKNVGLRRGGAVYLQGVSTPSFTGCTFTENRNTERAGGAVFVAGSTATFLNCTFTANESAGDGGALYLQDCTGTLTNYTFDGNEVSNSGALDLNLGGLTVSGSSFTSNSSTNSAGAVGISSRDSVPQTLPAVIPRGPCFQEGIAVAGGIDDVTTEERTGLDDGELVFPAVGPSDAQDIPFYRPGASRTVRVDRRAARAELHHAVTQVVIPAI